MHRDALNSVSRIPGISLGDAQRLRTRRTPDDRPIATIDDLWAQVGDDLDRGIVQISERKGIASGDIERLLVAQALHECEARNRNWLLRHTLDLLLLAVPVVLLVLLIRALTGLGALPSPFGIHATSVLAARTLEPGRVIEDADVLTAPVEQGTPFFYGREDVRGLVLAQRVPETAPLRWDDVNRLQVVASRDIPSNTAVTRDAVGLAWTIYDPQAEVEMDRVVGRITRSAVHAGSAIRTDGLATDAPVKDHVVANAATGLPPMQLIGPADVAVVKGPAESGAAESTRQVRRQIQEPGLVQLGRFMRVIADGATWCFSKRWRVAFGWPYW